MLKSDKGAVEIRGRKIDLMADFSTLVHMLVEKEMFTKDDINKCIEIAYMPEEEIKKDYEDTQRRIADTLIDLLLS